MLAQVDDDPGWVELGKRKVDRLLALTREKDGFRYLWKGRFRPGEMVPVDAGEPEGNLQDGSLLDRNPDAKMSIIYSVGALGHGSGLFFRVTGYEPALELSRGLARWALARIFTYEEGLWDTHHFHHSLYALMAVCEYGYAVNDREILERVDACYRWAREMGDPLIGFYPEVMPGSKWYLRRQGNTVEICEVADMVFLALYLTRARVGNYWDDVDRWVRNAYTEGQFCRTDLVERIPDSLLNPDLSGRLYEDTRDVLQRSVGSFFGLMRANDGLNVIQTDQGARLFENSIVHCCTANGARTLYYAWDSIVTKGNDEVRVNLLLNRASPWLDVNSYLPAEGKIILHIKDAPTVAVQMPEWCDVASVRASVDGETRRTLIDGRSVQIGWLEPGYEVTLEFPVPGETIHRVIGEIPYKLVRRGANIVSIDPPGIAYPLYEDQPSGKLIRKERFVPDIGHIIW
jgi:hypothetical protein